MTDLDSLRYPIGKFVIPTQFSNEIIKDWIQQIASLPARLKEEVENLNDDQLDTPYRPDGWTVRQIVNHCADSHMNALLRFKLTLTEDKPVIKPYIEQLWAELQDSKNMPIAPALTTVEGVHARLVVLLNSMTEEDFERSYIHPQYQREYKLKEVLALYAWHGNHHLAHITQLKLKMNWI
jgi:uncharacterized damage-inducible protein DinB